MSRVVISGSIAYDTIMNFDDVFTKYIMPQHLHTLSVNFNINEMVRYPWGTAHNIGYAMSQSWQSPLLFSSVWTDFIHPEQCENLDYTYVAKSTTSMTAAATIITDKEGNQITAFYPGSSGEGIEDSITAVQESLSYGIVSPNNPSTMMRHVKDLNALWVPFFFDPGQPLSAFSKEQLHDIMNLAPYLVVNEYEKDLFCRIASIEFDDLTLKFDKVLVTMWSKWVELWSGLELYKYPANHIDTVLDPTGAGDAFRGGLLTWLSTGQSWSDAIALWQKLAGLCIQTKWTMEWRM